MKTLIDRLSNLFLLLSSSEEDTVEKTDCLEELSETTSANICGGGGVGSGGSGPSNITLFDVGT